ncbi:MAG TPA: D-glycerate dehydrogenase [Stellaceae bacterium]|nr:D-glycerate dehydrogenase [Stellaceae bacterium]
MKDDHSARWSLLAIGRFPDPVKADFRAAFDSEFLEAVPPDGVAAALGNREALLLSFGTDLRHDAVLALPASLKAIATYSVGYEHIDVAAARERGLPVLNTPDVLTDAVAEVGVFLMLGAARRATESIDLIRGRRWSGWTPTQLIGVELPGKKLGVLGMGRIGRGIAQRARAFGMAVHYHNRHRLPPELEAGAMFHADFAALARVADVLMIAAHLSAETRHYLNAERIALLKPGAIMCNVGRGDLIEDDSLIAALSDGRVRAAGLDVFENEPNLNPRYYDLPNVFMLPHIGSSTIETRRRMGQVLIDGLLTLRQGGQPTNRVG